MTIERSDQLGLCCLGIISAVRKIADSYRSLAAGFRSSDINCRSDDALVSVVNAAAEATRKATRADIVADQWEREGVPAGYQSIVRSL